MGRVPKRKEKEQDMHDIYDYIRGPKRTGSGNTQMYPRFRQLHLSTVFFGNARLHQRSLFATLLV